MCQVSQQVPWDPGMCPDRMLIPRTKVIHHSLSGKYVSLTSQVSSSQAGGRCQLSHPFSGDLLTCSHVKCSLSLTSQGTWRWKWKNKASQGANGESRKLHLSSFSAFPSFYNFLGEACPACGKQESFLSLTQGWCCPHSSLHPKCCRSPAEGQKGAEPFPSSLGRKLLPAG